MSEIKIASSKGCTHCWGSGVHELEPFYYISCLWCQGTGKQIEEDVNNAKKNDNDN